MSPLERLFVAAIVIAIAVAVVTIVGTYLSTTFAPIIEVMP